MMNRLSCPNCRDTNLMENSTGEELLCTSCHTQIGLYDKSRYRLILFPNKN